MALPYIFSVTVSDKVIERINNLKPTTQAKWGKMNVSQMLAHCNVTYEMTFDNIYPKPNAFLKFIFKMIVKKKVVTEIPYQHNGKTAPAFIIIGNKDFENEKNRLINYISKTQKLGENHFDNKESHSFGVLSKTEWSNMFYKHLDHHLTQFGV
ncbi:DUF1569 domain-containing protein [Flavobacterium sp. XS2P14]|uniref:DUF1569 domain-containing protein n=1 Tax=Flavobacterium sp. XS2P14 TaxID=3401735 RepID=UPI003AB0BB46